MEAVKGARGLFGVRAAMLGWYVLSTIMWSLPLQSHFDLWFKASAVVWLGLAVAELVVIVPFSQGRQGTPAESPARAALIMVAVSLLLQLFQDLPELGGPRLLDFGSTAG